MRGNTPAGMVSLVGLCPTIHLRRTHSRHARSYSPRDRPSASAHARGDEGTSFALGSRAPAKCRATSLAEAGILREKNCSDGVIIHLGPRARYAPDGASLLAQDWP